MFCWGWWILVGSGGFECIFGGGWWILVGTKLKGGRGVFLGRVNSG